MQRWAPLHELWVNCLSTLEGYLWRHQLLQDFLVHRSLSQWSRAWLFPSLNASLPQPQPNLHWIMDPSNFSRTFFHHYLHQRLAHQPAYIHVLWRWRLVPPWGLKGCAERLVHVPMRSGLGLWTDLGAQYSSFSPNLLGVITGLSCL